MELKRICSVTLKLTDDELDILSKAEDIIYSIYQKSVPDSLLHQIINPLRHSLERFICGYHEHEFDFYEETS